MQYHCIRINTFFPEEWKKDVFDDMMAKWGVDVIDGNKYYIPSEKWEENKQSILLICQMADSGVLEFLGAEPCPDENWNAAWEAEHPVHELPLGVKIVPHCAFGAGHHETTSMMIGSLRRADLTGKTVLDHGTGTGVLAIMAKKRGADKVTAVDIDEKSVKNAKENAKLNHVELQVLHTSEYTFPEAAYDLIMANIHKNILIENMPHYAAALKPGGELWVSGFYLDDDRDMKAAAKQAGLHFIRYREKNGWLWMRYRKEER